MPYLQTWLQARLSQETIILAVGLVALLIGVGVARLVMALIAWLVGNNARLLAYVSLKRLRPPLYTLVPVYCLILGLRLAMPDALKDPFFSGLIKVATVALMYWLVIRIIDTVSIAITRRYDIGVKDNLRARQIHTRIMVVRRIAFFCAFILALSAVFLLFDTLRGLGVSLLASAGVAGLAIGLASQKVLGNLLAGIQIALTQPIRLEDAVVVEGEWGWVEEITLTYVVVRLWDLRRLVLPISYFIEKPFQNWTRTSASIIGTVEIYADYSLPVDPLRERLQTLLAGTMLWDGNTQVVQVTEVERDVMKIRILVSAVDSPTAFDLRCFVREQVVAFILENYPACLPKTRALLEPDDHRDIRPA
ncbi:MAG: mechanosensitive ion channel [Asticcacaulis sp.]|uniref:mechanosensitive ion channel family protein n=1 Tax=Asticcacaulis sp. TaxID=1872648 RepID=UPI0039E3FBA8